MAGQKHEEHRPGWLNRKEAGRASGRTSDREVAHAADAIDLGFGSVPADKGIKIQLRDQVRNTEYRQTPPTILGRSHASLSVRDAPLALCRTSCPIRIGVAFPNRSGAFGVRPRSFPTKCTTKLQVRDPGWFRHDHSSVGGAHRFFRRDERPQSRADVGPGPPPGS